MDYSLQFVKDIILGFCPVDNAQYCRRAAFLYYLLRIDPQLREPVKMTLSWIDSADLFWVKLLSDTVLNIVPGATSVQLKGK